MAPVKVGMAGYGNSARVFHLPHVLANPDLEVIAFLQPTPAPAPGTTPTKRHCTIDYPNCKHYTKLEDFVADKDIELIIVTTKDDSHASISEAALLAGKNVVCEKPLALSSESANQMIAARDKSGKLLIPFQNRRYDSDFRTVQKVINSGGLGQIHEMIVHYDWDLPGWVAGMGSAKYSPGKGMSFGIGCHKLDQVLHLFGAPATVTGFTRALRPGAGDSDIDDTFTILLHYPKDGPHANLEVSVKCNSITKMRAPLAYLVRGYEGSFVKFGEDPQEGQIQGGMKVSDPKFGVEDESIWGELMTEKKVDEKQEKRGDRYLGRIPSEKGSWVSYYGDVAKAVKGEIPQVIKAETSRDGLKVIELARQSAQEGKTLNFA